MVLKSSAWAGRPRDSRRGRRRYVGVRELHAWRDHDIHRDLAVDRLHRIVPAAVVENADHRRMRPHHRPHDAAFGAAIGTSGDDVYQHAITVHGIADGVRRNENIPYETRLERRAERTCVWNYEAEAVAVHGDAPDHQIFIGRGWRNGVEVGIDLNQFSRGDQLLKMRVQFSADVSVQAQLADQLLESGRALGLAGDMFEDGGIGGHEGAISSQHKPSLTPKTSHLTPG